MNNYILMDGALIHDALLASKTFASPSPLFAPLMPRKPLHLAGPVLIAGHWANQEANKPEFERLAACFPLRLHMAFLDSPLDLKDLAAHLRHYVHFRDDSGQTYGLRIGDSRVMAYLPQVLAPEQWDAMTAPIAQWQIHDRKGQTHALALNDSRLHYAKPPQPLSLTSEQLARLSDESEPDALLYHIGKEPAPGDTALESCYEAARNCIRHWKASGDTDRAVLIGFLRLLFSKGIEHRNDETFMQNLLHTAANVY
jgi:hypothetical protein